MGRKGTLRGAAGDVVCLAPEPLAAVDPGVLDGDHPVADRLRPLARLGRDEWSELGAVRSLRRVDYADRVENRPGRAAAPPERSTPG